VGIIESYSRATQSSNLRDDEHHHQTEKLAAVALSSELGAKLFRVKYGNDATSYHALLAAWKDKVEKKAGLRHWPKHITAHKVAEMSLRHWLNDVCEPCSGKGFEVIPGSPMLSDAPCKACKGDGKRALVCEENWRDFITDMIEDLDEMARGAASNAMKRLANDMDI
jgi:hypothetical protein